MAKEGATAAELTKLIMQEVRRRDHWNDVVDVAITRPQQSSPNQPNWDAAFTMNGPRTPPEGAYQIVRELQAKYDLC